MNFYQLYLKHGETCPIRVIRTTSRSTYWIVQSVNGQESGKMPGRPPYHNSAIVMAHRYSHDGKPYGDGGLIPLPCPGSYQWELHTEPTRLYVA